MLAGTISWLGGCALWATSVEYCRRRFFELFYKTHIIGLVTFFMFGYMHHVSLWAYTMPGVSCRCAVSPHDLSNPIEADQNTTHSVMLSLGRAC